jgi:hypothetical protein
MKNRTMTIEHIPLQAKRATKPKIKKPYLKFGADGKTSIVGVKKPNVIIVRPDSPGVSVKNGVYSFTYEIE